MKGYLYSGDCEVTLYYQKTFCRFYDILYIYDTCTLCFLNQLQDLCIFLILNKVLTMMIVLCVFAQAL